MGYDAFISYRRDNGFLMAQVIHDRLKERGVNCFLDLEELKSGRFDEKILQSIQDAAVFILVLPKNALDRCINEEDWLRQEILGALQYHKPIIPVMYDGFEWPQKWPDGIPEEMANISKMTGVSGSKEYLPAMIEKLISYMPEEIREKVLEQPHHKNVAELTENTASFFKKAIEEIRDIMDVGMAFHSGSDWRKDTDKLDILSYLLENKVRIRVIANAAETIESMVSTMKSPLKKYSGFNESLLDWTELEQRFPDCISVRVATVPLLHRLYVVKGNEHGYAHVKFYTHGNYRPENDFRACFSDDMPEYELFTNEFEYLWEHSKTSESMRGFIENGGNSDMSSDENLSDLLRSLYSLLTEYREAIRNANSDRINLATSELNESLQHIYLFSERNKYSDKQAAAKAAAIADQFNRYVEPYSSFIQSSDRMSPQAQSYAVKAEQEFGALIDLVIETIAHP